MLIRGRYVFAEPGAEDGVIEDGAVWVEDGAVADMGPYAKLKERYPYGAEIGSDQHVVLPGLIDAHDHGRGVSTLQMGIPDRPLEPWMLSLLAMRGADPTLAAAYAGALLIESGVTTVVHNFYHSDPAAYEERLTQVGAGYWEVGIRTVMALGILDRSPISALVERTLPQLPAGTRQSAAAFLAGRQQLPPADFFDLFERWNADEVLRAHRIQVALSPVSVHWCSDELLEAVADASRRTGVPVHTHMLETVDQRARALEAHGQTMVAHLAELGFLSPRLACAHAVWVTEADAELLADAGVSVIHNPSSNLRLHSGLAPLPVLLDRGVNLALGLDSNSLSDRPDLFQEMRLALYLHRRPDTAFEPPTARQVLRIATVGGARVTGWGDQIGQLTIGSRADAVLLRLDRIATPYVAPEVDGVDLVVQRAGREAVDAVVIDGEVVLRDGKLLVIDREALEAELGERLRRSEDEETPLGDLISRILPHVEKG